MKKLFLILMLLFVASPAWSADEWLVTRPALADDQWTAWPAASQANNKSIDRLLANYREGMVISYSSATTVSVSDGEVMCSNSGGTVRKMRQNPSATDVTFADIDTGAEEASKTYYIYAVADADATTATFKVSLSSTTPTGVTYFKRIGSFYNNSSSNIEQITNDNSPVLVAQGTIASGATISLPSGYASDQCKWMVSTNAVGVASGGDGDNIEYIQCTTDANRLVTMRIYNRTGVYVAGTANYLIVCNK